LAVLRGVSLTMNEGDAVVIMGPSGSGKSTLLNILGTLEPPTEGGLTIDGRDPFRLAEPELAAFRNRRIGFVFQDHHLLPHCSVLENVLMPTLAWESDEAADDRVDHAKRLLDRVGLSDRLDHRPAELSGGERQRAAVARALINRPVLVLADEPTGNLDRATAGKVASLIRELHLEEKMMLVIVTHSSDLADQYERRYELNGGELTGPEPRP
ncbi:MAG: ABC transporter ATP-binding protein, partial [Planctomycetota bacterium]